MILITNCRKRIAAFPTQLVLTLVWCVLAVPTALWWRNSVAWVSFMSIYAIIVSHWAAHLAWKAERLVEDTQTG